MMSCYVLTLRTDWVMLLFSNADEVITSAVMDFVTVSFCSSREDKKAEAGLGKAALRGCCVFSQGQDSDTAHCWVFAQPHCSSWQQFPGGWAILWRNLHPKGIWTAGGQPEERTWVSLCCCSSPPQCISRQGGSCCSPCLQKQDPFHAIIAADFGSQAVTALVLSLAKSVQPQMLS